MAEPQGATRILEGPLGATLVEETEPLMEVMEPLAETVQPDFPGAGIIEPAMAMGSGALQTVGGGVGGAAAAMLPGSEPGIGAGIVEAAQADIYQPQTQAGQEGLATVGDLVEQGVDILNIPLSGLAGLGELVMGQGLEQAADTIKAVQEQGLGATLGERVFEETGSPLAATVAESAPVAVAEAIGVKGAGPAMRGAQRGIEPVIEAGKIVSRPAVKTGEAASDVFLAMLPDQGSTKRKIAEMLQEGVVDTDSAVWEIVEPKTPIGRLIAPDTPRVRKSPLIKRSLRQNFDPGVVAAIKISPKSDVQAYKKMLDIMEQGKKNLRFAQDNRPTDIVGDLLMNRVKIVRNANREAGKNLDKVSRQLKGPVDTSAAVNIFRDDLSSMGVRIIQREDGTIKLRFSGSDLEGLKGPQNALKRVFNWSQGKNLSDPQIAHRLKRFIDENVSYGKAGEGLGGRTEQIIKKFRRNLDGAMDDAFPEYDMANSDYAQTKQALDNLQKAVGPTVDLYKAGADKASGQVLRGLMSNNRSRVNLLESVNDISDLALRFDPESPPGDILSQMLFADELDRVFRPVARTSFQGQIIQGLGDVPTDARGVTRMAWDYGRKKFDESTGINEEGAFAAMRALLEDLDK